MIKSLIAIIGTLLLLSGYVMANEGDDDSGKPPKVEIASIKRCAGILKVIDNGPRFEHPEMVRIFAQSNLKIIFENLTRGEYSEGRPLFTRPIHPRYLGGESSDHTVAALLTLETGAPAGHFSRKQEIVPGDARAELVITLVPQMVDSSRSTLDGNVRTPELSGRFGSMHRRRKLEEGSHFVSRLFLENFLSQQDLERLIGVSAARFQSDYLGDRFRLGTWKLDAHRAELRIRLDALTFAEFSVLLNEIALRIDRRSGSPDDHL